MQLCPLSSNSIDILLDGVQEWPLSGNMRGNAKNSILVGWKLFCHTMSWDKLEQTVTTFNALTNLLQMWQLHCLSGLLWSTAKCEEKEVLSRKKDQRKNKWKEI